MCGSAKFSIPADVAQQELGLPLFGEDHGPNANRYIVKNCCAPTLVEKFVRLVKGEITVDVNEIQSLGPLFQEFSFPRALGHDEPQGSVTDSRIGHLEDEVCRLSGLVRALQQGFHQSTSLQSA